jgi:hypothetical protein
LIQEKVGHARFASSFFDQLPHEVRAVLTSPPTTTSNKKPNAFLCTSKNVSDVVEGIRFGIANGENAFPKALENYSLEVVFAALWQIRYLNKDPNGTLFLFTVL